MPVLDEKRLAALYATAKADRWRLSTARFRQALEASIARAFSEGTPSEREVDRFLSSLHLEDLALACACAEGSHEAWDHFVLQYRPVLYRSAQAIDPTGAARDVADSLYAELYGLDEDEDERRSLFRYFHGRSSLATWLRSVLAQRWVDLVRARKRIEPLPEELPRHVGGMPLPDLEVKRYTRIMQEALSDAVSRLGYKEALRLRSYYGQQLTLAKIGRMLREHEATVSRQLSRTRRTLREEVQASLRRQGFSAAEIERCFEVVLEDSGTVDLDEMFSSIERKIGKPDRSE